MKQLTKTLTTVCVTASGEPTALHAAQELTKYLQKKGVSVSEGGFPISITVDSSFEQEREGVRGGER